MDFAFFKKSANRTLLIVIFLLMAVTFVLRIIPAVVMGGSPFFPVYDTDTWYNLRQIEVMVQHFPQYNWFDPLTAYPAGKSIDWGPLYPFLASILCIITGSVSHTGIISMSGFLSPLLAAGLVPVLFGLGTLLKDRRTGLVAAGLVPVTCLLLFSFSSYGMIDHHVAEIFFTSLFFLLYIRGLAFARDHPVRVREKIFPPAFLQISAAAGILYFLGLLASTTVILTLLVIAVFTLVQGLLDFYREKSSDYLLVLNAVAIATATLLLLVFGFQTTGISFSQYSVGIVYLHGAIIAETLIIWIAGEVSRKKRSWFFAGIAGLLLAGLVLSLVVPVLQQITGQAYDLLFGYSIFSVGVQETLPWSLANAYDTLNAGILLLAGGFLVLVYLLRKGQDRGQVFLAVWSVLMLFLTIQHQRFLYYFTITIILLMAFCITESLSWPGNPAGRLLKKLLPEDSGPVVPEKQQEPKPESPGRKGTKKKKPVSAPSPVPALAGIGGIAICIITLAFLGLSLQQDVGYGLSAPERVIPDDWLASLDWMKTNTPDPQIAYFTQYNQSGYTPPPQSYGVMAVWDAGHWITFFAHRPAITNPFQDNLAGPRGAAAFFLEENEENATGILKLYRGRYVITDSAMAVDRFTNLVPWRSGSTDISRYIKWFLLPAAGDPLRLEKTHRYDSGYFQTMVARLHNFDGSLTEPATADYVTYSIRLPRPEETADATGYSRVITGERIVNVSAPGNATPIIPEGSELMPVNYAALFSTSPVEPVQEIPALRRFRLVHESDHNASVVMFPESAAVTLPGIRMVKIFEYVKGARIAGTGVIEVPVETNTGRTFIYRQESTGGEFIVPYSSSGSPYEVRATGPYHISGTDRYITVTEDDVINGKTVKSP